MTERMAAGYRQTSGKANTLLLGMGHDLLAQILAAECERYLQSFGDARDAAGREAVVRNGFQPVRYIETGVGPIKVRVPKVRSRTGEAALFRSAIVPRYLRRTPTPTRDSAWRFFHGLWCCDLNQVLAALLGARAAHLAGAVPVSVRVTWAEKCRRWRSAPASKAVEIWAEAIPPDPDSGAGSIYVVVGSDSAGALSLLALDHGRGDGQQRWGAIARSLMERGLRKPERVHAAVWAAGFNEALGMQTPELTAQAA